MHIAWGSLGVVFVVSFGSAVAVVVLVTLALVGLSSRAPVTAGRTRSGMSSGTGTALAALCLMAAAAIVLFGLYTIIA
jgi:hypothetical protein